MAVARTLRAVWIDGEPLEFTQGSSIDEDSETLTVNSLTELPWSGDETVTLRVELTDGTVYEGRARGGIPMAIVREGRFVLHVQEFSARPALSQSAQEQH